MLFKNMHSKIQKDSYLSLLLHHLVAAQLDKQLFLGFVLYFLCSPHPCIQGNTSIPIQLLSYILLCIWV